MRLASLASAANLGWALCLVLLAGTQAQAQVFLEDFDDNSINPDFWTVDLFGSGPQLAEADQELQIVFPSASSGVAFGGGLVSNFLLRGDFDVQVDYRLITWPFSNGVRLALAIEEEYGVERTSFGSQSDYPHLPREVYLTHFSDGATGFTATSDVSGTLRLVRVGATETGYYYSAGDWVLIHTGPGPTQDVAIQVHAWSHDYAFMDRDVIAAWDNLVIRRGELVWPGSPSGDTTWGSLKALFR
jgi:hypothetical protein